MNSGRLSNSLPYDWRQPISYLGEGLATQVEALTRQCPGIQIALVAHSMGGLVAADALAKLGARNASVLDSVKALVVLGAPFLGSGSALQALRAEKQGFHLLKLLGRKSTADIENTVQTFRGLFDMLPGGQEETAEARPVCAGAIITPFARRRSI